MIIKTPTHHCFVTGSSEGFTPLNAFDGALLNAGVGNTNILRMSSIIPPRTQEIGVTELKLPAGALVPMAYAAMESDIPGSYICAAVAAAWPENRDDPALIMEYHSHGHRDDAENIVRRMAEEGIKMRGWTVREIKSISIDLRVDRIGAVFAGVVLWDDE